MRDRERQMKVVAGHNEADDARTQKGRVKIEAEQAIAQRVMTDLLGMFPGYPWSVSCTLFTMHRGEKRPGGVQIHIPAIMPEGKYYNIPLAYIMGDHNQCLRKIREAGGYILEVYRVPRTGINFDSFLAIRPKTRLSYKHQVPT